MEEVGGPPPNTAVTSDISNIPAPPYPGPPLDSGVVTNQTTPVQPAAQTSNQPVAQHAAQQYPQVAAQQYQKPIEHPHSGQQPAAQYIPQQNQTSQQINQVVMVQQNPTEAPGNMTCPHCRCTVVTKTENKLGVLTWTLAGVLFIVGCWPCFLIPFFVSSCKDVQHSCPQCNNVLHIYRRL